MTLSDKLQLINTYKGDIRTSIANKGVDISSTTPLADYSDKIADIESPKTDNVTYSSDSSLVITQDGIVSGFSNNYNHIEIPTVQSFDTADTWEINLKFYVSSMGYEQRIFRASVSLVDSGRFGIGFAFDQYGKANLSISFNGSSWAFDEYGSTSYGGDTIYYVRMSFDGSTYKTEVSTDGTNYTAEISHDSTSKVCTTNYQVIGCNYRTDMSDLFPLRGNLYLKDCYIKLNGVETWRGAE